MLVHLDPILDSHLRDHNEPRVIYMLERFTEDGKLEYRLFARNKRTADKLIKAYGEPHCMCRYTRRDDAWHWIDWSTVI